MYLVSIVSNTYIFIKIIILILEKKQHRFCIYIYIYITYRLPAMFELDSYYFSIHVPAETAR